MSSKVEYVARSLSRGTHKKYETFIINEVLPTQAKSL